jgi:hypothetical protein
VVLGGEIISFGGSIVVFLPLNLLFEVFLVDDNFSLLLAFFLSEELVFLGLLVYRLV